MRATRNKISEDAYVRDSLAREAAKDFVAEPQDHAVIHIANFAIFYYSDPNRPDRETD